VKDLINPRSEYSHVWDYRRLVTNPESWIAERKEELEDDEENASLRSLHPIEVSTDETSDLYKAVDTLQSLLSDHKYEIMETDEIALLDHEHGLVSCDCKMYLHYVWCYHACSMAFDPGIIRGFSLNLNPSPQYDGARRGRPNIARWGGALGHV